MITIGSLFAGIGGFELGLERAIPNSQTIWQVEQDKFCKKILHKHWPNAVIYDDVCTVGKHNLEPVDIICGGFPCQGISQAGKMEGLKDARSGLWWEMHRIIGELRPRVAVLENVPNLIALGLPEVLGSLSEIGYDAEWTVVQAGGSKGFGAPHLRKRLFIVAYSRSSTGRHGRHRLEETRSQQGFESAVLHQTGAGNTKEFRDSSKIQPSPNPSGSFIQTNRVPSRLRQGYSDADNSFHPTGFAYWAETQAPPPVCSVDDGIPDRLAKLRALGNAIVPQCSEWVGRKIWESGLLE